MDRFQRKFPTVDLRFQIISGSLRDPVVKAELRSDIETLETLYPTLGFMELSFGR